MACVLFPHFPLLMELDRQPALRGQPVVITDGPNLRALVLDCSPEAAKQGVRPGMALRVVLALCRGVTALPADPVAWQQRFTIMLDALERVSPLVEPDELGCAFVGLKGLGGLYGTLGNLTKAVDRRVEAALRRTPQTGIATGKFAAKVAALRATPGSPVIVPGAETREFLASASVDLLPMSEGMRERLHTLGLTQLGQLAELPLASLQAQFGREGAQAWRLARGLDTELVRPREHRQPLVQRLAFDAPEGSRDLLAVAVQELVGRLYARQPDERMLVQQVRLRFWLEDGRSWEQTLTPREVIASRPRLLLFLISKLALIEPPGPVTELALEVTAAGTEPGQQGRLFQDSVQLRGQVQAAVRQLVAQYGHSPVLKAVEVEPWSRIPERRWALITYEP